MLQPARVDRRYSGSAPTSTELILTHPMNSVHDWAGRQQVELYLQGVRGEKND